MEAFGLTTILGASLLLIPMTEEVIVDKSSCPRAATDVVYANFIEDKFFYLNISVLSEDRVERGLECGFACLQTPSCFSFNVAAFQDNDGKLSCELLPSDKNNSGLDQYAASKSFHHFDIVPSPCNSWPCKNKGTCLPVYAEDCYVCVCEAEFTGKNCEYGPCKFDFEDGIDDWEKTGTVFDNQPTYGDNPTARNKSQPASQQGNWWIGGFENRSSEASPAGELQGDEPQGTLTSPYFYITGNQISFLIGGGCDIKVIRAELIIGHQIVRNATGACHETMIRKDWDVHAFIGQRASVKLVDFSSGVWGHINFDDLRGDIRCM